MAERKHLASLSWTSLRAFEAAARLGSFKAAAAELSVTPTAISHQIKRLEAHLGLQLFLRLHRALQLTPSGEILAGEVQDAFARVERTIDGLMVDGRAASRATLTVSAVPSLAAKWLAPRLHLFQAAHPRISLRVVEGEALVDFRRDRAVDIALRYGPGPYGPGVHAERLWPAGRIVAVAAPTYPRPRTPRDLARHVLIRTAPPASAPSRRLAAGSTWSAWLAAAGVPVDAALRRALDGPVFGTTRLAVEAATAGQGIALAPEILVAGDIAAGRLVRPFAVAIDDPNAFWLLCRSDRARESRIRAFIGWIRLQAGQTAVRGRKRRRA